MKENPEWSRRLANAIAVLKPNVEMRQSLIAAYEKAESPSRLPKLVTDFVAEAERVDKSSAAVLLKAGRNVIAEALERLHAIPRVDNRHIDVPWPILPRPKLKPEEWAESTIESVMIESLFASQQLLTANRVEYYVKNPGAIEEGRRAFANVYSSNDGLVIVDGHHRLTALWLLGADMANVWFLSEGD